LVQEIAHMANLNKVMLIGRLTRDPEVRTFSNGGKVSKFGFAVNNRRKNQNGEWEEEPVFLDVDAFNRGDFGKLADTVEQYLRKGQQIFIEGHLKLDQWTSQDGQKRSRLHIVMDNFQFLEPRADGGSSGEGPSRPARSAPMARRPAPAPTSGFDEPAGEHGPTETPEPRGEEEGIPF
jgi:single-strand DNA-binding protein